MRKVFYPVTLSRIDACIKDNFKSNIESISKVDETEASVSLKCEFDGVFLFPQILINHILQWRSLSLDIAIESTYSFVVNNIQSI